MSLTEVVRWSARGRSLMTSLCGRASWALLLSALAAHIAAAQPAVVKQNVNLRAEASVSSTLIRTLYPGDELTLLRPDTVNRYVEVRTAAGLEGWVYTPRIRVLVDSTPPPVGPPEVYRGCGLEGNAQHQRRRELNRLKNRVTAPNDSDIDSSVTLAAMLAPGDDRTRWSVTRAASITAFVIDVKPGGQETVNCGAEERAFRDTHIELVLQQGDTAKRQRVVVEVTPRWREFVAGQGQNWSTEALRTSLEGRLVRFTGWLFFDDEHDDEAENTRPGRPENWRATAWEIHPVTRIEVLPQ